MSEGEFKPGTLTFNGLNPLARRILLQLRNVVGVLYMETLHRIAREAELPELLPHALQQFEALGVGRVCIGCDCFISEQNPHARGCAAQARKKPVLVKGEQCKRRAI